MKSSKDMTMDNNRYGVVEVKQALCLKCGEYTTLWAEVLFHADTIAKLTPSKEELKKMGMTQNDVKLPIPNEWLPMCPDCFKLLSKTRHFEVKDVEGVN